MSNLNWGLDGIIYQSIFVTTFIMQNYFPKDKKMQKLLEDILEIQSFDHEVTPKSLELYFSDLCESIIGQQLSSKVADVIIARVKAFLGNHFKPEVIISKSIEELRSVSLSNAKASYLQNLSKHWLDGSIKVDSFDNLSDDEIIKELVAVKGIGKWTAEMFMIFTLGRKDIYSSGDLILRKGVISYLKLNAETKPKELDDLSKKWSPHRTLASRIIWKGWDLGLITKI